MKDPLELQDPCDITPEFLRRVSAYLGEAADDYAYRINAAVSIKGQRAALLEALDFGYCDIGRSLKIVVVKRTEDWTATMPSRSAAWEAGKTEAEAIGNLMITLHRCWPERGVSIEGDRP